MLRKLSTLLVVGVAALTMAFAVPTVNARGFCKSGSCGDVVADAHAEAGIGFPAVTDQKVMGYAQAGGKDLVLTAQADAQGKDQYFLWWKVGDGFADAEAHINELNVKARALVISTGVRTNGGLSLTIVKAKGTLDFNASALATGNFGCLQTASAALSGEFGAKAGGYAQSTVSGIPAAGSTTSGFGSTIVGVEASDSDSERYNFCFIFPINPSAEAEIDGKVTVTQGLLVTAYTSKDGTHTANFGLITGGSAKAYGDANLTSVRANGKVMQEAQAVGAGGYAYGNSMAAYTGAGGTVNSGCRYDSANANGLAVVTGFNSVVNTGNSLSITSHQTAHATTGQ